MSEINLIDDFYLPLQEQEKLYSSKEYNLLKKNNVDTAEYLGLKPNEHAGVIEMGKENEDDKRKVYDAAIEYLSYIPKDLMISATRGTMNGFDFLKDIAAFAKYGNEQVPEDSVFNFIDERIERQKNKLNELEKDDPITTQMIGTLGQDAAFVYPLYKKFKSVGVPTTYAFPLAFTLGTTFAFDKTTSFMLDTETINGLKQAININDDTPAEEMFDKMVQALEFTGMGFAFNKIAPMFKAIKKSNLQQSATAVGGSAAAGEGAIRLQSENEELPPLEFNNEPLTDEQSAIPGTVNEYGFPLTAGVNVGAVSKMLSTKGGEAIPSLQKLGAEGFLKKTRANFNKLADEGKLGKDWYKKSGQNILDYVNGDKQAADQFAQILAIYSPQKPVATNTQFAIKAWNKFQSGEKIWNGEILERATIPQDLNITQKAKFKKDLIGKYGGGKRAKGQKSTGLEIVELDDSGNIMLVRHGEYENIAEKTKDLKAHLLLNEGIAWNGRKTNNFYNNIMKEINPELKQGATIDLWMNRAGGFVSQELKDGPKYNFIEEVVDEVAKQKKWDIDQAQAAIWVATKGRFDSTKKIFADAALDQGVGVKSGGSVIAVKGKEKEFADLRFNTAMDYELTSKDTSKAAFDFADALEDNLAFVSWETVPGSYSKHLNQLSTATPNIKSEYQFKVSQIMNDADGSDLIAKKLKILSPGHFEAPGYYQGVTNPSGQTKIATTRVKGAGKDVTQMDAPSEELLELYAAARGVVLNQDAIGYHRIIKAGSQKNANSIAIRTDRKFSADEVKKLGAALDQEFGDGHALIAKEKGALVINVGDLDNIEFQKRLDKLVELNVDGESTLIYYKNGNLITRDKTDYGKNYSEILGQTRRSDLRQLIRDLLSKKKNLDRDFADKYGYDYDERAFSEFDRLIGD